MATPAAILSVLVEAETSKATASLRAFDKNVARTSTTAKGATGTTSKLNSATSSLGRSMWTAAKYAGGAAAAYVGIAQAKAAITTTQDLAKTTAGLNRNLGLSVKRASEWGTVAKARDIDSKSLTMSFTTLSRRITDLSKGSAEAKDSFADIGITQKQLEATNGNFNDQVLLIADAFGKAEGGAVRQQAAQKLLGRGYQTILPLFAEGSKSLQEQTAWADKYGTTLNQKTLRAQMDLVSMQRESKVAWMGLQVTFAKFVTPALETVNEQFQDIARIMGSDKLTETTKLKKVGNIIAEWGEKAYDAFATVLPKIIQKAGEQGPKIASALIEGFTNANIVGKLTMAAVLMGGKMGDGIKTGLKRSAIGLVIVGAFEAFNRISGNYGAQVAEQWATGFGVKLENAIAHKSVPALKRLIRIADQTTVALQELGWGGAAEDVAAEAEQSSARARRALDRLLDKTDETARRGGDNFRKVSEASGRMGQDVAGNLGSMVNAVGQGLKTLGSNTNKALSAFGAKKLNFTVDSVGASVAKGMGKQQGGIVVPGSGSGDKVPLQAMVEPGEGVFVLNRNAMGAMQAFNDRFPRFQQGGIVGLGNQLVNKGYLVGEHPAFGGVAPVHSPGSYHYSGQAIDVNWSPVSQEPGKLDSLYGKLKSMPGVIELLWRVANHFDHLHVAMAQGANASLAFGGNVRLDKLALGGPDGPLKSMGQGSLDMAWSAARKFLDRKKGAMAAMPHPSSSGAMSKGQIAKLWNSVNPGLGNANLMAAIAMAESSGNPAANGPPDGRGLWQIEWPIWSSTLGKYGNPFNPAANAKMAGQVLKQQGLGAWVVYNTGAYQQFLQKGGALPYAGSFGKGGIVPGPAGKPFTATVHGGEEITPRTGAQWERAWKASAEADRERAKEVRDLIRELVNNQRQIMRSGRQEKGAIAAAIAAAASGQIGGKVQLESNTPTPGRLASY